MFFSWTLNDVHVSQPYSRVLHIKNDKRKPLCKCLTFWYYKLLQSNERKYLRPYLPMRLFISVSNDVFDAKLETRYKFFFTFLISLTLTLVDGKIYLYIFLYLGSTLVFLRLMATPKSENAEKKWLSMVCRSWAEIAPSTASSEKKKTRIVTIFRFRFSLRLARLKIRPSLLVWSLRA